MSIKKTILALSAHTDDIELGCGGTISKLSNQGHRVYSVSFSEAPSEKSRHRPSDEFKKAMKILGVAPQRARLHNFPRRNFYDKRQQILQILCDLEHKLKPDIIFCPSRQDTHQDHEVIAQESFRAFKHYSILGYELPWNTIAFDSQAFMRLEKIHIERKIKAIQCYRSQKNKIYTQPDFLRSWAKMRGGTIGQKYAETFEVVRLTLDQHLIP